MQHLRPRPTAPSFCSHNVPHIFDSIPLLGHLHLLGLPSPETLFTGMTKIGGGRKNKASITLSDSISTTYSPSPVHPLRLSCFFLPSTFTVVWHSPPYFTGSFNSIKIKAKVHKSHKKLAHIVVLNYDDKCRQKKGKNWDYP